MKSQRIVEALLEDGPDDLDPKSYAFGTTEKLRDETRRALQLRGFKMHKRSRVDADYYGEEVETWSKTHYLDLMLTRTMNSVGGAVDPIWAVDWPLGTRQHASLRQSKLISFLDELARVMIAGGHQCSYAFELALTAVGGQDMP